MFDDLYHEPYFMSTHEKENVKELKSLISSTINNMLVPSINDLEEPMTPTVTNTMVETKNQTTLYL